MQRKREWLPRVVLTLAATVTLCGQVPNTQPPSRAAEAAPAAQSPPQVGKRSADWRAVQRIAADQRIELVSPDGERTRGVFVSADDVLLVLRSEAGERSIRREDIRRVRVYAPSRRTRNGLIATAIGAGVGLAIGFAVCPQCSNEGAAGKYTGPFAAAAAGVGAAIGFLPAPYRTVYKSK